MIKPIFKSILIIFFVTATIAFFQNCAKGQFFGETTVQSSLAGGDSYPGKIGHYLTSDLANPCQRLSSLGRPFPSREIFYSGQQYTLVRDNCQDITPIVLDPALLQVDPTTGAVTYQGQSFDLKQDLSEFNQVPLVCPAGRTVVNSAPANIMLDPLSLGSTNWATHPEIRGSLYGSIEALPRFEVRVTSGNMLESWRRVSQSVLMKNSTQYVTTFLMQRGTVDLGSIQYADDSSNFVVLVDFNARTAQVNWTAGAIANLSTNVQVYGNGLVVSVFFTTANANVGIADLGVAPYRANSNVYQVNDSVYATAARLLEVGSFCSP